MTKLTSIANEIKKRQLGSGEPSQTFERVFPKLIIPDGFILVIDTNEQLPLFGNVRTNSPGLVMVRKELPVGDYSVVGFEEFMCIERKRISDFYSYIGAESIKTQVKLERMAQMRFAAILIESPPDLSEIYYPMIPTKVKPQHAHGRLVSFRAHYGIHVFVHDNRKLLERFVLDHFIRIYEYERGLR